MRFQKLNIISLRFQVSFIDLRIIIKTKVFSYTLLCCFCSTKDFSLKSLL